MTDNSCTPAIADNADVIIRKLEWFAVNTPYSPAILFEGKTTDYTTLNLKSGVVAKFLKSRDSNWGTCAAICMFRSPDLSVAILGVVKVGLTYVPIDPEFPQERIKYILDDCHAGIVICDDESIESVRFWHNGTVITASEILVYETADETSLITTNNTTAYIIYTSGTTGTPKGVMVSYRSLWNRLLWGIEYFKYSSADVFLQKTNICFDVSLNELFTPFLCGATLVFAKPGGHTSNDYIRTLMTQNKVTVANFAPSALSKFLLEAGEGACPTLQRIICSGEALKITHVSECRQKLPHVSLYNLYGPTEAAIEVTYFNTASLAATDATGVPIGHPIAGALIHILDENRQKFPVGEKGELYIGGVAVAKGYLNMPELTSKKFIPDPFSEADGAMMYQTGDIGSVDDRGLIWCYGRTDRQVKIWGNRIELQEIENTILMSGCAKDAVVVLSTTTTDDKTLKAYLVPVEQELDLNGLRTYLASKLPAFMLPALWTVVPQIPINANGKTDYGALDALSAAAVIEQVVVHPKNEAETTIAAIWKELLKLDVVSVEDNFFELGGFSMLAAQMICKVDAALQTDCAVTHAFIYPTIRELSDFILLKKQNSVPDTAKPKQKTKWFRF
jgi:amino acid adenylation domain-containing protein